MSANYWSKTANGYAHPAGHTLARRGKIWTLTTAAGVVHKLGRRASFDTAERYL